MKNIYNYFTFINESNNDFNKIISNFEESIDSLHKFGRFKEESNKYFELFNEIGKYLQKNNLLSKYDSKLKDLLGLSNKLKSFNKVDDQFNSLLKQIIVKKNQLKSEILGQNQEVSQEKSKEVKPIGQEKDEMSKKRPNMTRRDVKEIDSSLNHLMDKHSDNKVLSDLYNKWMNGDDKDKDIDFWDDKIREIFKK